MQVAVYSRQASHRGEMKTACRHAKLETEPESSSSNYGSTMKELRPSSVSPALERLINEKTAKLCGALPSGSAAIKVWSVLHMHVGLSSSYL